MVVVQRLGGRRVGAGLLLWAIAVDVCLFVAWTRGHAGIPASAKWSAYLVAFLVTVLAGTWVGWRRRMGTAFAAPLLAWLALVPFAFASGFVTNGVLGGLWRGFVLSLAGGFVAACIEGVFLVAFSVVGRLASGALGRERVGDVTILPPRFR